MPFTVAIGVKANSIESVSEKLKRLTGCSPDGHESSFLGEYDLFRMPEDVQVKYNFVEEEEEWDYPQHKEYGVLIVAQETDRPDYFRSLVARTGFESIVLEETPHLY